MNAVFHPGRTKNDGLKVLLLPEPGSGTITVNVTYLVGSRHEGFGETGRITSWSTRSYYEQLKQASAAAKQWAILADQKKPGCSKLMAAECRRLSKVDRVLSAVSLFPVKA